MKPISESPFPSSSYNLLPHIDQLRDANDKLAEARKRLLLLIEGEGLQDLFSVQLIHKHFNAPDGHVMVYETLKCDNGLEFQTCSPKLSELVDNWHGVHFLAVENGTVQAYEYTKDPVRNIQPHLGFIGKFFSAVNEIGVRNMLGLAVKRTNDMGCMHEFEIPDLRATILVKDPNFLEPENTIPTNWGIAGPVKNGMCSIYELSACTKTRSGTHHKVGSKCTKTRSGTHYPTKKGTHSSACEDDCITLNGRPVPVGSDAFKLITCARKRIETDS